jgi:hypothetical protein
MLQILLLVDTGVPYGVHGQTNLTAIPAMFLDRGDSSCGSVARHRGRGICNARVGELVRHGALARTTGVRLRRSLKQRIRHESTRNAPGWHSNKPVSENPGAIQSIKPKEVHPVSTGRIRKNGQSRTNGSIIFSSVDCNTILDYRHRDALWAFWCTMILTSKD